MILEKIQHHLGLSFLVVLIFAQSMFFLGARASLDARDDLQALFIEPSLNANIEIGEQLDLKAHLYVPEQEQLSGAYFSISNQEQAINVNFDADLTEEDYWAAYIPWDTSDWQSGAYQISATAYVYDEAGAIVETYISDSQTIHLIEPVEYESGSVNLSESIRIILPEENAHISIDAPFDVVVITEGISEANTDRNIRLIITDMNTTEIVEDGMIFDFIQNDDMSSRWESQMDTSNLEPGAQYRLNARLINDDPNNPIEVDISASSRLYAEQASGAVFSVTGYNPQTGAVLSGQQNIALEFMPSLPESEEIFVRVLNNDTGISHDLGLANIDTDRQSLSIDWNTAETEGDFADLIYPDSDLSDVESYYNVNFYRLTNGATDEVFFNVALYQLDNESAIEDGIVSPGPVDNIAYLSFSSADPIDASYNIKARVNTAFGDYLDLPVAINDYRTLLSIDWNTKETNEAGQALFPDSTNVTSAYHIQIYNEVVAGEFNSVGMIHQTVYHVQNESAIFEIYWDGPSVPYSGNDVALEAITSQAAEYLNFEIINNSDASISSGLLQANLFNSDQNLWVALPYAIPDTWPNGAYSIYMYAKSLGAADDVIETQSLQPLTLNRMDADYQFIGGPINLSHASPMTGVQVLKLHAPDWSEEDLQNVDITFIIKDINDEVVKTLEGSDVILELENKNFLSNFDTNEVANNSTFRICFSVFYEGTEIDVSQSCGSQVDVFNLDESNVPDELLGTLEVEFLEPLKIEETNSMQFRAIPESDSNAIWFVFEHIASGETFDFSALKPVGEDAYKTSLRLPPALSGVYSFPVGDYRVFFKEIISGGVERWSNESPYPFSIPEFDSGPPEEDVPDTVEREVKLYVEEGSTLHTQDNIFVSTDFYDPSIKPALSIKIKKNDEHTATRHIPMTPLASCDSGVIPQEIRIAIDDSGHSYCWQGRIPPGGAQEEGDDGAVDGAADYSLESGLGMIVAGYEFYIETGEINKEISDQIQVSFVFTDRGATPVMGDTPSEPGTNSEVTESNLSDIEYNKNAISFSGDIDCIDFGIYDDFVCKQFVAMLGDQIDAQCLRVNIYEAVACENYLLQKQVQKECDKEEIVDPVACQDWLLEKYMSSVECRLDDRELCTSILRDKYLSRLVVAKNRQEKITSSTEALIGQVLSLDELSTKLIEDEIDTAILPLEVKQGIKVLIARSTKQTILESAEQLTVLHSAVMIIDTDADGLSDDMERYYGTDINNPDTDADTYLDGEEVANGYNPIGEGKLEKDRSILDKIISSNNNIEQPKKFSNKIDEELEVNLTKNEANKKIVLSGTAEADTWLTIFLYSDLPLVMTTKTDASGNWSYDLQHSLIDGSHKVYVTVNDDTGRIVKQSNPLAFLVKSAQAVTADQYFDTGTGLEVVTDSMLWLYVSGALFLIVFGIIFILHRNKNSQT